MPTAAQYSLDANVLADFSLDLTPELAPLRQIMGPLVPVRTVGKSKYKYQIHSKTWFTDEGAKAKRAPGQEPRLVDYDLTSATGTTVERALMHQINDEQLEESDDVLDPYEDGVELLRFKLLLELNRTVAASMATTGNFGSTVTLAGATQWSDGTSSVVGRVETGKEAIRTAYGSPGSLLTFVCTRPVFSKLRIHPEIKERFGGGWDDIFDLQQQQLAVILGVRRVVVLDGVYNSANPGQTVSMADVFGKHAWLMFLPENGVLTRKSRSYHGLVRKDRRENPESTGAFDDDLIEWDEIPRSSGEGRKKKARWITGSKDYDYKVFDTASGYMFEDAVA